MSRYETGNQQAIRWLTRQAIIRFLTGDRRTARYYWDRRARVKRAEALIQDRIRGGHS